MIDFIIVEDNEFHRKKLKSYIINYMMKNKLEFDIIEFEKEDKKLLHKIKTSEHNKIYVLDFELPNTNAIEISRKIRQNDWTSPIIIFTVNGGMAYETFKQRLQILDFVNKQYEPDKNLYELFDICLKQLNVRKCLKYTIRKVDYFISYDKILYIHRDTQERKLIVVTDNKEYKIPLNLCDMKNYLDKRFKITHKACIVNTDRVEAYIWKENKIIFDNGLEIYMLSKTHKKELVNQ